MGLLKMLGITKSQPPKINTLLQMISKRAERLDPLQQAKTFVSLGGIEQIVLNPENRIIFGRRGTGKSHLFSYVSDTALKKQEFALVLDLRKIGSNSYIYNDDTYPLSERATRLLRDFLTAIHDDFMEAITKPKSSFDMNRFAPLLERLGASVKEIVVKENIEKKQSQQGLSALTYGGEASTKFSSLLGSAEAKGHGEQKKSTEVMYETIEKGAPRLSLNVGEVGRILSELANRVGKRIWILIDEWSTVPEVLQPYLADFIKRTLFPIRNYSVQIAAIEHRAKFRLGSGATSIGIELGSDAFADVNLDDHLVFENSPQRSIAFFKEMLYRHLAAVEGGSDLNLKNADEFVGATFTQTPTFRELVRASEGVPRDAINILQVAAARAQDEKISIPHIREAAKDWYDRDKASYVTSNPEADELLHWIVKNVIGDRKAKAFLVRSDERNEILDRLFDERILHIAKRSYSTKQEPGIRYKVWKIDYGCYVDLINTSRAPTAFLLEGTDLEGDSGLIIPEDDFRAIRRAVLTIADFEARTCS